jgi:hypothetical protein
MGNQYATFVTLPPVGSSHTIRLEPMREEMVQEAGMDAPRRLPVQGSGKRVQFFEGEFVTKDPHIIKQLLHNPKWKFGIDIDINRSDPTGFWRKYAEEHPGTFSFEVEEVVTIKNTGDVNLGTGPRPLSPELAGRKQELKAAGLA